ncbi:MAG: hypothetical protein KJP16_11305 [Gammaproteobacteria bacterium]|nr:hypothetical protein [Gammaproteobacteria bacterium]
MAFRLVAFLFVLRLAGLFFALRFVLRLATFLFALRLAFFLVLRLAGLFFALRFVLRLATFFFALRFVLRLATFFFALRFVARRFGAAFFRAVTFRFLATLRFEAFLRDFFLVAINFLRVGYPALSIYNKSKKSRKLRGFQALQKRVFVTCVTTRRSEELPSFEPRLQAVRKIDGTEH